MTASAEPPRPRRWPRSRAYAAALIGLVLGAVALGTWYWCPQEVSYCGYACPTHHTMALFSECPDEAMSFYGERVNSIMGPEELTEEELAAVDDCDEDCRGRQEILYRRRSVLRLRLRLEDAIRSISD